MSSLRFLLVAALAAAAFPAAAAETANAMFLIAGRELVDPNFEKTVVLVTHPEQGSPFGVIINRPLTDRLSDVMPDQPSLKGRKDVLYFGGPVARQGLVFLVRSSNPPPGAVLVLPGVFFTADTDLIESLLKRPNPLEGLRVFAGYSGWGPGQLQREIARGGWHVAPADSKTVFDKDPKGVWPELIERATSKQTRSEGEGMMANTRFDAANRAGDEDGGSASPVTHHPTAASFFRYEFSAVSHRPLRAPPGVTSPTKSLGPLFRPSARPVTRLATDPR
jgi:putative transcriptional regulator